MFKIVYEGFNARFKVDFPKITKVDMSWSSMEQLVGSNQTMNPPGAAGSQHCWRQHSGDPSSSALEQLYTL